MKYIFLIYFFTLFASSASSQTIPTISFVTIEGDTQPLTAYNGKKIIVITLPISENAGTDSMLYALDTLATAHASTLQVIAVPSWEDGYTTAQKAQLQQWYRSKLGAGILITEGLYTRKTSGSQQHALFKWLTDEELNGVFNIDVSGPAYKFFVRETGHLYGVLRPQSSISGTSVQKTLQIQ